MTIVSGGKAAGHASRVGYFLELLLVASLTLAGVSLLSVSDAVEGGWGSKLLIPLRMAALIALCSFFLWRRQERWASLGLCRPERWWFVPLLVAIGFMLIVAVSLFVNRVVLPWTSVSLPIVPDTPSWAQDPPEFLFWLVLVSWGSAAIGEEMLARGFILDRIAKVVGSERHRAMLLGVIGQAVLFGSFHLYQGLAGAILTGLTGLVLGLVWLWGRRNLWACILLHGLVNSLAASGL